MTLEEFAKLVREMREAQNAYFRNRTRDNLEKSMAIEKRVDEETSQILDYKQGELF